MGSFYFVFIDTFIVAHLFILVACFLARKWLKMGSVHFKFLIIISLCYELIKLELTKLSFLYIKGISGYPFLSVFNESSLIIPIAY